MPDTIVLEKITPESTPVTIGNDVWVGGDVSIRSGIHIGTGAIIAAVSIVTHDVEPYTIVGGVSAKVLKSRFKPNLVKKLLATSWWRFTPQDLITFHLEDPIRFIELFFISGADLTPLEEVRMTPRKHLRTK